MTICMCVDACVCQARLNSTHLSCSEESQVDHYISLWFSTLSFCNHLICYVRFDTNSACFGLVSIHHLPWAPSRPLCQSSTFHPTLSLCLSIPSFIPLSIRLSVCLVQESWSMCQAARRGLEREEVYTSMNEYADEQE